MQILLMIVWFKKNVKFVNQNNRINFLSSKGKSKFRLNNILLIIFHLVNKYIKILCME